MTNNITASRRTPQTLSAVRVKDLLSLAEKVNQDTSSYHFLVNELQAALIPTRNTRKSTKHVEGCSANKTAASQSSSFDPVTDFVVRDCCKNTAISSSLGRDVGIIEQYEKLHTATAYVASTKKLTDFWKIWRCEALLNQCSSLAEDADGLGFDDLLEDVKVQLTSTLDACSEHRALQQFRVAQIARIAAGQPRAQNGYGHLKWRRGSTAMLEKLGAEHTKIQPEGLLYGEIADLLEEGMNTDAVVEEMRNRVVFYMTAIRYGSHSFKLQDPNPQELAVAKTIGDHLEAYVAKAVVEAANLATANYACTHKVLYRESYFKSLQNWFFERLAGVTAPYSVLEVDSLTLEWLSRSEVGFVETSKIPERHRRVRNWTDPRNSAIAFGVIAGAVERRSEELTRG